MQNKAVGWCHNNALQLCLADTQLKVQLGHCLSCLRAFVVCIMKITNVVHRLDHLHFRLNTSTHSRIYARATGAQAQGGILKKIEIEIWYAERKVCPRERNWREIYTENNVGTTARPSFLVWLVCLLVPKKEEGHFASGIAGIVELINCTWKLIDNTVLYFLQTNI